MAVVRAVEEPAVTAEQNLVSNGDFEQGLEPWGVHAIGLASSESAPKPALKGGALCTRIAGGQEVIVGWPVEGRPEAVELIAGQRYEMSLTASSSGASPASCFVKLGHQRPPYTALALATVSLSERRQGFSFVFAPEHSDDLVGIAVECRLPNEAPVTELCIDDVLLLQR
jgi:hypothetical protein